MIRFKADLGNNSIHYRRIYKKAILDLFKIKVESKLQENPFIKKANPSSLDKNMKYINNILQESLDEICPNTKITHKTKTPWNNELEILKRKTKKRKTTTLRNPKQTRFTSQVRKYRRELQRPDTQLEKLLHK